MYINFFCQASPGKLIYDPFIGTGSMAYVGTPITYIFAHTVNMMLRLPPASAPLCSALTLTDDKCVEKVSSLHATDLQKDHADSLQRNSLESSEPPRSTVLHAVSSTCVYST